MGKIKSFLKSIFAKVLKEPFFVSSVFGIFSCPKTIEKGLLWTFSQILENGRLAVKRYASILRRWANMGANATREPCYWINLKLNQTNYLPWWFKDGKYDLGFFNAIYFDNLRAAAEEANRVNMVFIFSIFDSCHRNRKYNPWNFNHQHIHGWYQKKNIYRAAYIKRVFDTLEGLDFMIEPENEPIDHGFLNSLRAVVNEMKARDINKNRLLMGARHPYNDPSLEGEALAKFIAWNRRLNHLYTLTKRLLRELDYYDKSQVFRIVHGIGTYHFLENYRHIQSHTGRYWISDDGDHPKMPGKSSQKRKGWKEILYNFFKYKKKPKRNKAIKLQFAFEHLCRFEVDDFEAMAAIAEAYKKYTGHYPKNWGKFPGQVEPEKPPDDWKKQLIEVKNQLQIEFWELDEMLYALGFKKDKIKSVADQLEIERIKLNRLIGR